METPDDWARERDELERVAEREPTVIELMNGPRRASESRRRTVLWIALTFTTLMLVLTVAVISLYGLDFLTLLSLAILGMIEAAMIGALRYKGEDPMEQFDPIDREPPRPFWRRSSK